MSVNWSHQRLTFWTSKNKDQRKGIELTGGPSSNRGSNSGSVAIAKIVVQKVFLCRARTVVLFPNCKLVVSDMKDKEQKGKHASLEEIYNNIPKIDEWSILGVTTAISGKRQEMDSAIVRPTPTRLGGTLNI